MIQAMSQDIANSFEPGDLIVIKDFGTSYEYSNKLAIYIRNEPNWSSHVVMTHGRQLWLFNSEIQKLA